jgi:hypothetical protein
MRRGSLRFFIPKNRNLCYATKGPIADCGACTTVIDRPSRGRQRQEKFSPLNARNPLKSPNLEEQIQANESKF